MRSDCKPTDAPSQCVGMLIEQSVWDWSQNCLLTSCPWFVAEVGGLTINCFSLLLFQVGANRAAMRSAFHCKALIVPCSLYFHVSLVLQRFFKLSDSGMCMLRYATRFTCTICIGANTTEQLLIAAVDAYRCMIDQQRSFAARTNCWKVANVILAALDDALRCNLDYCFQIAAKLHFRIVSTVYSNCSDVNTILRCQDVKTTQLVSAK